MTIYRYSRSKVNLDELKVRSAVSRKHKRPQEIEFLLAANELLASVVDVADRARWPCFSANQVAARLGYGRPYVQRVLSRLRKRGLLRCLEVPRTVRGGFRRGIYNMYYIPLRGRERANWWKRHRSVAGLGYLASGLGNVQEMATNAFFTNSEFVNVTSEGWRLDSRDHAGIFSLLAALDPDAMNVHVFSGEKNLIGGSIYSLKQRRIIPEEILEDFEFYVAVAGQVYRASNTQILIALLFRSLNYWKKKAESLQAPKQPSPPDQSTVAQSSQLAYSHRDACVASQEIRLENEINRKDAKLVSALLENLSLSVKLSNMQQLTLDVTWGLSAILNELRKIEDPTLAPIQWFIGTSFAALTLMIHLTLQNNYPAS